MSFNFLAFMTALNKVLPVVGEVVKELHPENTSEATKINTGVALIAALTAALQDAHSAAVVSSPPPLLSVSPPPSPAPVSIMLNQ